MSTRISQVFESLKSAGQMAFMPFVTAGDPDLEATKQLITRLASTGVNLIEIGFPYSDPIADGPVIQASYTRALGKHVTVPQIMQAIASLDTANLPPLLAMVSYAIIFRTGVQKFLDEAKAAGFSGLIVPDLPGDEAAEMFEQVTSHGLDLVQLVAPTTPPARVRQIIKSCSGFVYCIAVSGTTGERSQVKEALLDQLRWLRKETTLPLAVGFGISQPDHVAPLKGLADGVIVGSAIVKNLQAVADGQSTLENALENVSELSAGMVSACQTH